MKTAAHYTIDRVPAPRWQWLDRMRWLKLALIALLALPSAGVANASTSFTVTTTADIGPGTLRQAIIDANASGGSSAITLSVSGVITLGSPLPALDSDIAFNGPGAAHLTLSGNHTSRIFHVDARRTVSISGLTIADGQETGFVLPHGGAILNEGALTITNCTIAGNTASTGGGIADFSGSTLTMTNSIVSGNTAGSDGGGMRNDGTLVVNNSTFSGNAAATRGGGIWNGAASNNATLSVSNSTFSGNTAGTTTGEGGAVWNGNVTTLANSTLSANTAFNGGAIVNEATLTITNTTVSGNTATNGGAIFTPLLSPGQTNLTIQRSTLSGNSAASVAGAIFHSQGTLTLDGSSLSGNTAGLDGGAIFNSNNGGQLTVGGSTISGNAAARDGGGIENLGSLTGFNSTLSGNSAGRDGGGIWSGPQGASTLRNVTITGNHADNNGDGAGAGGGISTQTGVTLHNTIVAGNVRGTGSAPDDVESVVDNASSFNLIGDGAGLHGCCITDGTNGNQIGTDTKPIDPMLSPLQHNGGQTATHALLPGSPAIDAGNNAVAVDARNNALATDQRDAGFVRIYGGTVDIGAFELQPIADITPPTINCTVPDQTVWYGADVSVGCTASDSGSGLASPSDASFSLLTSVANGTETSSAATGSHQVCDSAGNCVTAGPYSFKVDKKAPAISATALKADATSYTPGGWTNQSVTVHFACADDGAGISPGACPVDQKSSQETPATGLNVSGSVSDAVGNGPATSNIINVKIDTTPPTVSFTGNAGTYTVDQTITIGCSADDALSGVASDTCAATSLAAVPAATLALGPHTLTASATDNAGNGVAGSTSFTVAVNPGSLCLLTKQFFQGSAKYQALSPTQKAAADKLATTLCQYVAKIVPTLTPKQKAALIALYQQGVAVLASAGWLTASQAQKLSSLATSL